MKSNYFVGNSIERAFAQSQSKGEKSADLRDEVELIRRELK